MARSVDDELIILDVRSGRYFGLNDVGALIWGLLDGDHDRDALLAAVTTEFDVDEATAGDDLDALLAQLRDAGLVEDE
jgi:hypothetical protein